MQEKDSVWTGTLLLPLGNNREAGFTSVGDTVRGALNKKRKAIALMTPRNHPISNNQGTEQLKRRKLDSTFDPN